MAKFLAVQIRLGTIEIDDVPENLKQAVQAELNAQLSHKTR